MKDNITMGEKYGPAMEIQTEEEAADYLMECILHNLLVSDPKNSIEEATRIEQGNIAYYAGYFDNETRARVEKLFKCEHPIFGAIAEKGPPTPEQAFRMGQEMGEKMRQKTQATPPCVPCVREIDLNDDL